MTDPLAPIQAQTDDYAALLAATRRLAEGPLAPEAVAAYRAERARLLERVGARDPEVNRALAAPATDALARAAGVYRETLEALVAAERDLAGRAGAERDALGRELSAIAHGRRALDGYRSPGTGPARAVSRHV